MPDLIGHDLILGSLLNEAYFAAGSSFIQIFLSLTTVYDRAVFFAERRKFSFEHSQQCGFSAARHAAKHGEFPVFEGKRYIFERRLFSFGISEAQIFDL